MAKNKELHVSVAFTKNLGNYQSLRVEAGVTMALENDDSSDKVFEEAWDQVGDQIQSQLALFDDEKKSGMKKGL
ncbi:hypothetical protein ACPA0F_18455 [Solibacillus silvestris]